MSSQLQNTHYFIFQHRDLVWSWKVNGSELEKHKSKVLPKSEKDKMLGINKIVNAFSTYDSKDMETYVMNGCIEHAFAMKGDITQLDARVHWLFISNGEKGKWLELEELEDKNLQLSYLSKSFVDSEIPNIGLINSFKDMVDLSLNDNELTEEDKDDLYFVFRTMLHNDILNVMLNTTGGGLKSVPKDADKRDIYLYNEVFNLSQFHIQRMVANKTFERVMLKIGADKILNQMVQSQSKIIKKSEQLYGSECFSKHFSYTYYESQDRDTRLELRGNKKVYSKLQKLISNHSMGVEDIKEVINLTK